MLISKSKSQATPTIIWNHWYTLKRLRDDDSSDDYFPSDKQIIEVSLNVFDRLKNSFEI